MGPRKKVFDSQQIHLRIIASPFHSFDDKCANVTGMVSEEHGDQGQILVKESLCDPAV